LQTRFAYIHLDTFSLMTTRRSKSKLAGELGRFVQQYARRAQKGWDPNDRSYDRKIESKLKQLSPEELSELLSGEEVPVIEPKPKKDSPNEDQ
jgi:hypothetical protein